MKKKKRKKNQFWHHRDISVSKLLKKTDKVTFLGYGKVSSGSHVVQLQFIH